MAKKKGWIASVLRALQENDMSDADVTVVVDATVRAARARECAVRLGYALAFHGAATGFERPCYDVPPPGYTL